MLKQVQHDKDIEIIEHKLNNAMTLSTLIATFPSIDFPVMEAKAAALAAHLKPGDIITLQGELGAGKTSFARALIGAIAVDAPEVTSPTFTLMQPFDVKLADGEPETLWHLDLYRLKESQECEALGLEELWPHITLIEWPDIAKDLLPAGYLEIAFDFGSTQESRTLTFLGNDAWRKRLSHIG